MIVALCVTPTTVALSQSGDPEPSSRCPTPEEAARHYEQTGQDLKPEGPCTAEGFVKLPASAPEEAPPPDVSNLSLEELQQKFDPNDDPALVVGKNPDGSVVVSEVLVRTPPKGFPGPEEARVKTPADLKEMAHGT